MNSVDPLVEGRILVDSYGADSALVRLAQLASPACRIEPQLLRRLRLECVPDADVSIEQELWHSELVDSRGTTITFRSTVMRVLRERLSEWRHESSTTVERAREVMAGLHADLPPVLRLEDALAWAEVFDDRDKIRDGAESLLRSLLAARDGLDHWLARAWSGLPAELKRSPEGRELAQVAAARGAPVTEESGPPAGDRVAHMLPAVPLPIRLEGQALTVNAPAAEATHVIDIPDTHPRSVSVLWNGHTEDLVFATHEAREVRVAPGVLALRTLAGTEYEIEVRTESVRFDVEILAAGQGVSLIIRYGSPTGGHRVIVDCGDRKIGERLIERLSQSDAIGDTIELVVITHIHNDRIGGAMPLLENERLATRVRDVWFNGEPHVRLPEAF